MRILFLWAVFVPTAFATSQLTFWHSMTGEKGKLIGEFCEKFNHSPINEGKFQVVSQFVGNYEEGLNKLRTALLAKQGPHIAQITDIGCQVMIDTGAVVPLQEFIDKDPQFPIQQLLKQIRKYYEVGGKLYSLPFATSNPILYYNVDSFERAGLSRAPKTFGEFREWAQKLTDPIKKTQGVTWPLSSWFFEEFIARQGQQLLNHDNGRQGRATEALYLTSEAIRFVELWQAMVKEKTFANVGRGWDPAEASFLSGRTAMLLHSTSEVFGIAEKVPFRVATAPIPLADEKNIGGTVVGGNSLWILKDKPKNELLGSYQFVKFMASSEVQRLWHVKTGYFPIRSDVIQALEQEGFYLKYPLAKTAIDQLKSSANSFATQGALMGVFSEARDQVESAIERVLAGRMTAREALQRAKVQTDDSLRRYNRFLEKLK
jgi:sn-glycerol 3-phosphate transport system substrate-binding protein